MKDVKELKACFGTDGRTRYRFGGKSIGIANAVKLIEDYCKAGADYELRANFEVFKDKKARSLQSLSVSELSKVEWFKGTGCIVDYMKPVYGEIAEIKLIVDAINTLTKSAAA